MKMAEQKTKQKENEPKKAGNMLAAVLIRGILGTNQGIRSTLQMLRLYKKNTCVIIKDTPSSRGMLNKLSRLIAWGEADAQTIALLKEKREIKTKDHEGNEVAQQFYRLNPPRGGFERKGTKIPYEVGGALGYRGSDINALIKRMV
jgi:large subunit ribosomal protein L30